MINDEKKKELKEKIKKLKSEIKVLDDNWAASDNSQYASKIFMNSFFGVFANPHFRYNDVRLASAVTTGGQMSIKGPMKYIQEEYPMVSIDYCDTDSLFINLTGVLKDRFKDKYDETPMETKRAFCEFFYRNVISPIIKKYYEKYTTALNFMKNTLDMDFEVIADKTLFIGKKRYIMDVVYDEGDLFDLDTAKLKIKGVEINRTNTPMIVRNKLKELVRMIIKTDDNNVCLKYITGFQKEFFKEPFENVAKPTGVKGMDKYELGQKSVPIHVRAAKIYNKALKDFNLTTLSPIGDGEKIKYSYIKQPNIFQSNVIACIDELPDELRKKVEVDYKVQFEKTCMKPAKLMFDALNWKTEKTASLEDFF